MISLLDTVRLWIPSLPGVPRPRDCPIQQVATPVLLSATASFEGVAPATSTRIDRNREILVALSICCQSKAQSNSATHRERRSCLHRTTDSWCRSQRRGGCGRHEELGTSDAIPPGPQMRSSARSSNTTWVASACGRHAHDPLCSCHNRPRKPVRNVERSADEASAPL